ncbi:MAG: nuclear transport factor 2 family protein [Chitinophagaceae bacterium]|nr:nuclear transport factor 2 family protein [Chitinophagaceae bacterium]
MKKLMTICVLILCNAYLYAQDTSAESEIRKLEEKERQAVLKKDTIVLAQLWGKDFMVNAPTNRVVLAGNRVAERPVIAQMSYSSFTREVEEILVKGDIVFSMGNEVVVPAGDNPKAGQTIKRRYTNIWMKQNGDWKLVARHANQICQ